MNGAMAGTMQGVIPPEEHFMHMLDRAMAGPAPDQHFISQDAVINCPFALTEVIIMKKLLTLADQTTMR